MVQFRRAAAVCRDIGVVAQVEIVDIVEVVPGTEAGKQMRVLTNPLVQIAEEDELFLVPGAVGKFSVEVSNKLSFRVRVMDSSRAEGCKLLCKNRIGASVGDMSSNHIVDGINGNLMMFVA